MAAPRDPEEPSQTLTETLDRDLNRVLEPPPAVLDRVVRAALAESSLGAPAGAPHPRRSGRLRLAGSLASLALVAAVLFVATRFPWPGSRPPDRTEQASITSVGGIVVARSPRQDIWFVRSQAPAPPAPGILIVRHGGGS
jgi:hypothetical protein